jgi:predicted nucleic acid-binding protein
MSDDVVFVDTNVLIYLFDHGEPGKRAIAKEIFRQYQRIWLSTQVLQEFCVVVTRKLERPLAPDRALQSVQHLLAYPTAVVTPALVIAGIRRSIDSHLSLRDALIVETALSEGAGLLITEDLQDGWQIGAMRVWNPFSA